jgi:hypothetical protein
MMEATMTSGDDKRGRRMKGLLRAAPGLVAPVVLLVVCIMSFAHEAQTYYALPLAERTADGDPFSADAGMFFAGVAIVVALLLFVPPLLAALPARLRVWQGVVVIILEALPLLAAAGAGSLLGWLAFAGFAYVPVLALVRLLGQHRAQAPQGPVREAVS